MIKRVLIHLQPHKAQPAALISQRPKHRFTSMLLRQRLKLKQRGPGQQCAVHIMKRVFCRCANENNDPLLHSWQKRILP
ncbi:hypothetical protein D3C84_1040960 [compost metagenome]